MGAGDERRADDQPATVRDASQGAPLRAAVLAGHRGDAAAARRLALHDDPAVRAAALGALDRMGALDDDALAGALGDPDPVVRGRACLLAGRALRSAEAATTLVLALTDALCYDADVAVVEAAAWALGEAGAHCGPDAVQALATVAASHRDALCREAAVAALGAVGAPAGLDAVLGALDDKPPIRRRAAIALAVFDDRRADDALRRCRSDRDWQVRQAAEDLLADDGVVEDGVGDDGGLLTDDRLGAAGPNADGAAQTGQASVTNS